MILGLLFLAFPHLLMMQLHWDFPLILNALLASRLGYIWMSHCPFYNGYPCMRGSECVCLCASVTQSSSIRLRSFSIHLLSVAGFHIPEPSICPKPFNHPTIERSAVQSPLQLDEESWHFSFWLYDLLWGFFPISLEICLPRMRMNGTMSAAALV